MPGRDGTGPMGRGAMTGRGFGVCAGTGALLAGMGLGLGLGCRRGLGRGLGRNIDANQASAKTPKELLQEQKELLQKRLESIDQQMENM